MTLPLVASGALTALCLSLWVLRGLLRMRAHVRALAEIVLDQAHHGDCDNELQRALVAIIEGKP